jgi:hypothetical protein
MKLIGCGTLVSLGMLTAACVTEEERAREAVENVREEVGEAREEVAREVEEGREEVARAERNLAEELREMERSGKVVEFEAVLTGPDQDPVMLRLEGGDAFEVDYNPDSRFRRGVDAVKITEIPNGQDVRVTYRVVEGRRLVEQIDVLEGGAQPTPAPPPTPQPGAPTETPTPGTGGAP